MATTTKDLPTFIAKLQELMPQLRDKYHVSSLGVFGSYVRGEQKRGSDLDVLVEFSKVPSLFTFVEIELFLAKKLGVKVDLVMKTALKPAIGEHILQEVIPVFSPETPFGPAQ